MTTTHDTVAGYRIEAVAGRGGMGVVYRARQLRLERLVALKLIAPELSGDESFRARFERESRIAASLDHPNVIPVYEAGEDNGRLYIAMRFVEGTDLARMLAAEGALGPALAAELVAQAASALDAAHARGLVHRDVKPANLLIAGDLPARPHVYLTDFGVARRDGSSGGITTTGQWMGTPDYAAPEQIDGYDLDARSDVYALGCVLFAALTGSPPFADRPRMAKAAAHLHAQPPSLRSLQPSVPLAFEPVIARALAKRREDRYQSAGELGVAALEAAGAPGARAHTGATARLVSRDRLPRGRAALVAALIVLCAGLGIAAALGAFSGTAGPSRVHARSPLQPPPPNPVLATVRCSPTQCDQRGARVVTPIEGSGCRPGGRLGHWARIDADGRNPLFGCVPDASPPPGARGLTLVPDLAGARLDHAEQLLDRFGVSHHTSGGGIFGIIDSGNWTVCATTPSAGALLSADASVKLFVDRSC